MYVKKNEKKNLEKNQKVYPVIIAGRREISISSQNLGLLENLEK